MNPEKYKQTSCTSYASLFLFRFIVLAFVLFVSFVVNPLQAQVTGRVDRVKAQPMSVTERTEIVPEAGALIYLESDPSKLYVGDGETAGGKLVTPATDGWDHSATQNIKLNGYKLQLGNGFDLIALGGYQFLSGGGEISAQGNVSQWGDPSDPYIRLTGGDELGEITAFTWDSGDEEFTATITGIGVGAPTIQTTDDLITGTWTSHTATVTGPSGGSYTAVFEATGAQAFFRALYPSGGSSTIELLKPTLVSSLIWEGTTADEFETTLTAADPTADRTLTLPDETGTLLTTSSTITSGMLETAVTDDIAEGVTAHGWGDHAAAGYLTQQTTVYTLGFYEAPDDSDLDWLLIARAATIDDASPGVAYCRTTHTAQTTYTITKNGGASLGTIVFDADPDQTGTVTLTSGDITLAAGDRLEINGPGTADATGADIQISLVGVLQ